MISDSIICISICTLFLGALAIFAYLTYSEEDETDDGG
jgi:hypothetical protein